MDQERSGRLMRVLGLVCCRGGSKGLPGKNIKPLAGKPLLGWTLDQAKASGVMTDIACSSDDADILKVAADFGANIIISRPPELATDEAGALPTITHAINEAQAKQGYTYDWVVFMQATSPLRRPSDIAGALELAQDKGASSVISAYPAKSHITVERKADGAWGFLQGKADEGTRRQDAGHAHYTLNGSIYVWNTARYLAAPKLLYPDSEIFVMPEEYAADIDYQWQFDVAEILMKRLFEVDKTR